MILVFLLHVKNVTDDTFSRTVVCFVDLPHSPQYQAILREGGTFQTEWVGVIWNAEGKKSAPEALVPSVF